MAPVAPARGTPQQALKAAVAKKYPRRRDFYAAVAKEAQVTPHAAKGTFYGFLRTSETSRGLPEGQRAAYLKLLPITMAQLAAIEDTHPRPVITQRGRNHLAELGKGLEELTKEVRRLTRRVRVLEQQVPPKTLRGTRDG